MKGARTARFFVIFRKGKFIRAKRAENRRLITTSAPDEGRNVGCLPAEIVIYFNLSLYGYEQEGKHARPGAHAARDHAGLRARACGDAAFQEKSKKRTMELMSGGMTVLFVSHSLEQIRERCARVVWLDRGKVKMHGDTKPRAMRTREAEGF